jgi:hypothetical protein
VFVIGDEMQDRDQQQGYRLAEVDQFADLRVRQDRFGLPQVRQDDPGGTAAGQQGVGVHVHDRVVVHVGHARSGCDLFGYLVDIADRRDTRADVDDLPYPCLADQEPHGPLQECPVGPRGVTYFWCGAQHQTDGFPVHGIVVFTAEICVIHARWVRPARVDLGGGQPGLHRILPARRELGSPTMHPDVGTQADYDYEHFMTGGDHCCQRPNSTAACIICLAAWALPCSTSSTAEPSRPDDVGEARRAITAASEAAERQHQDELAEIGGDFDLSRGRAGTTWPGHPDQDPQQRRQCRC